MTDTAVAFQAPKLVTDLPARPPRGGKTSLAPALTAWLDSLPQDGKTYELVSNESEPGHASNRIQQLRKLAEEKYPDGSVAIETRTVVPNKRYRVFGTKAVPEGAAPATTRKR